ncbi:hypothetical protein E2C01_053506 [Portunus trituberculatus]|uniref:Uncharacterized protein n=1 Tax=Portunus trituberculatus TaxID=210409 RepID=A0A5B7GPM3_PORTR|nr:hypothetical protein [Portunus trituberculatus]
MDTKETRISGMVCGGGKRRRCKKTVTRRHSHWCSRDAEQQCRGVHQSGATLTPKSKNPVRNDTLREEDERNNLPGSSESIRLTSESLSRVMHGNANMQISETHIYLRKPDIQRAIFQPGAIPAQ